MKQMKQTLNEEEEEEAIEMKIDEVASTTKKARVATHTHIKVL